jgi:hypothetical protein
MKHLSDVFHPSLLQLSDPCPGKWMEPACDRSSLQENAWNARISVRCCGLAGGAWAATNHKTMRNEEQVTLIVLSLELMNAWNACILVRCGLGHAQ